MVLVDIREPKKVINEGYRYFPDMEVVKLEVGDVVDGNIVIERKTSLDFSSSVNNGRVFNQAVNMRANYQHCYIIVVGDYEAVRTNCYQKMDINRYIGSMADLVMLYKVPVLHCQNNNQFWRYCQSIFKKVDGDAPKQIKRVNQYNGNAQLAMLCGIPGLGEKKARALLRQFSIHEICHADEDDLMTTKGIGRKHAANIKKWLHD